MLHIQGIQVHLFNHWHFHRPCLPLAVQVGGFTIFRNEDLGNVLPMWIKYTEDVREDLDVSLSYLQKLVCLLHTWKAET